MDQQLKVFITVAEKKNFSRAAEKLLMTQPAVSQYIRTFEDNLGVRLLERTSKYVRLTKAGELVYHHGIEIVGLYTRMHTLVDDLMNRASGPLSIGASFTFGEYVLPHIIAKMLHIAPDIKPSVTIGNTKEIVRYLKNHQVDIGIVEGKFKEDRHMHIEDFAKDYMVVVASKDHPLVNENKYKLAELEQERWILREIGSGTRAATDTVFKQNNIKPEHTMSFGSTQAVKESVGAGLGISLLSQWAIQRELHHEDLRMINIVDLPFTREFSIVTASPFQTKAQQVFIDLLHSSKEITNLDLN